MSSNTWVTEHSTECKAGTQHSTAAVIIRTFQSSSEPNFQNTVQERETHNETKLVGGTVVLGRWGTEGTWEDVLQEPCLTPALPKHLATGLLYIALAYFKVAAHSRHCQNGPGVPDLPISTSRHPSNGQVLQAPGRLRCAALWQQQGR